MAYWLTSIRTPSGNAWDQITSQVTATETVVPMEIPSLSYRSFDSLIKLTDDLAKADPQVETALRRVEKQLREFKPEKTEFHVHNQGKAHLCEAYVEAFSWNSAMFPADRMMQDNLSILMKSVSQADDGLRTYLQQYQEVKTAFAAMAEKEGAVLSGRDLVEVLAPNVVDKNDFVETEHLTTVLVVVPKGQAQELTACYENLDEEVSKGVVPDTAKQIGDVTDKDGNTLWRVVMFKKVAQKFKELVSKQGSSKKFLCRDFTYSSSAYGEFIEKRKTTKAELDKLEAKGNEVCEQSFSDLFVAWMHVKAMRVFVDSVLRFGLSAEDKTVFTAFVCKVPSSGTRSLHECISGIADATPSILKGGDAEEDEYNGYVALPMTPLIE